VAAALLVDRGYRVTGITARMWKDGSRCCSLEDIDRARRVCDALGIRHVVIHALDAFARCVADRFAADYARGRTPSPCVVCNQLIKFGLLLERAVQLGCDALATGHYARREHHDGVYRLLRAADRSRDQSYFLHRLSQRQLARALFPLGDLHKRDEVLPYAAQRRLPLTSRGESRDLCFVEPGMHPDFVERRFPGLPADGAMVDADGREIGRHRGLHRYTIGQRKGLGVAVGEPLYVTRIDAQANRLVLGTHAQTLSAGCLVEDPRWIAGAPPARGSECRVQIRYRHRAAPAVIEPLPDGRLRVRFRERQFAVTPGQAAVFYRDDEVLGGGWIGEVEPGRDHDPGC
jgi:tRNA-specific 2-thiouridylase